MQSEVSNRIQLGQDLNPLNDLSAVPSIDNQANVKDLFSKVDKLGELWDEESLMKVQLDIYQD